jgi:hypothetical protein
MVTSMSSGGRSRRHAASSHWRCILPRFWCCQRARVIGGAPEALAAQIRTDIEVYGAVARAANIQID